MKKFKLIVILFVLLFAQKVHYGHNNAVRSFSYQNIRENESGFETYEFFHFDLGDLPSAQVFFNVVPEAPVSFSSNAKTKNSIGVLVTSKTKIIFNLSFHQTSIFGRYCSVFVQIFLKTACYRL